MIEVVELGMPGPLEMLIIGMICVLPVVALVVIAVVLVSLRKSGPNPADNPNLYPCPDCGQYVSRMAPNCPHCGQTLTPQQDIMPEVQAAERETKRT